MNLERTAWFLAVALASAPASALITVSGDVSPATPTGDPWFAGTLRVGQTGFGSVDVLGASGIRGFEAILGGAASARGEVELFGTGSNLDFSRDLTIGDAGSALLDVSQGGLVINRNATLAAQAGAFGEVRIGANSRWENSGDIDVGRGGTGLLRVNDGGYVEADFVTAGGDTGSFGSVSVNGVDSRLVAGGVGVASFGYGELSVINGATADIAGRTWVRTRPDQVAGLWVNNRGVLNTNELYVSTLDLTGDGTINTGGLLSDIDLRFTPATGAAQTIFLFAAPELNGLELNVTPNATADLGAGYLEDSEIDINGGVVVPSSNGYLGYNAGARGAATINGPGSKWEVTNGLFVGFRGTGELTVDGGAAVDAFSLSVAAIQDSSGTVLIRGAGTTVDVTNQLDIAGFGDGQMTIDQGAVVTSASTIIGALTPGVTGSLTVDGPGSSLDAAQGMAVGFNGDGVLNVSGGATITSQGALSVGGGQSTASRIVFDGGVITAGGVAASSAELQGVGVINTSGLVTEVDLAFDASNPLVQTLVLDEEPGQQITVNLDASSGAEIIGAGYRGQGMLRVADGHQLQSTFSVLGFHAGADGRAEVHGANTRWDAGALDVGAGGFGSLTVTDGAVVAGTEVASSSVATGTSAVEVIGPGSRLEATGAITLADQGLGTLLVADGGVVSAPAVSLGRRPGGDGEGVVIGPDSLIEATTGDLTVGSSGDAILTILDQALAVGGGGLRIGSSFGSFTSRVRIHSGGRLAAPGDRASSIFSFLVGIDGNGFGGVEYWDGAAWTSVDSGDRDIDYTLEFQSTGDLAGFTVLTVGDVVDLPGDYNEDGVVDAADYTVWRDQIGSASALPNDLYAGTVGDDQYAVWAANFGRSAVGAGLGAVPEPAAFWSAIGVALTAGGRYARRRR